MGLSVIPIRNDRDGHKRAACKWEQCQKRAPRAEDLNRMFRGRGITGVAVVLGPVSGNLYGRDFDDKESYWCWAAHHPDLATILPTVETPRGFHVYFRSLEPLGIVVLGDGEQRGIGGYLVLPPSLHPCGERYRWLHGDLHECPLVDYHAAGFLQSWRSPPSPIDDTERAERTERAEITQRTETTEHAESTEMTERTQVVRGEEGVPAAPDLTVEQVIKRALPGGPHQNHELLFVLARGAKAIERQEGRAWPPEELKARCFNPWYRRNQHLRAEQSKDSYWFEFLEAYDGVRVPLDDDVLAQAWDAAVASELPDAALQFDSDQVRKLVAWTCELQRRAGEAPFFLSCRSVQERLALDQPKSAARLLRGLVKSRVLEELQRGNVKTRKASRYRYIPAI
jgi:hypothetical protein